MPTPYSRCATRLTRTTSGRQSISGPAWSPPVPCPARLVIDFKPKGDLKAPLPAESGDTVLVEPRSHASISDPLTVNGYSRNSEAANTITLIDSDGKILVRKTVLSNDRDYTWGYFETTLDLPPFSGKGTLRVGTESARNGSFEGTEIPLWAGQ